jgi:C1A family cysteine protease
MIYNLRHDALDERDLKFNKSITPHPEVALPQTVDLRTKCPPIYDQGKLGSCTANAGCAYRVMLLGEKDLELSRLFLYYEERRLHNQTKTDSGATLRDTCKVTEKVGICEEKYMPYITEDFSLLTLDFCEGYTFCLLITTHNDMKNK